MAASSRAIRPARPDDHGAYLRLFPELKVDDPPMEQARFVRELMATTLVVEGADPGQIVGYSYFQIIKDVVYVRHVVTAPEARKTGIGRSLMSAIAARAREAGCTAWCLNVKPDNTAAIALYEQMGMARAFRTKVLVVDWAKVGSAGPEDEQVTARVIDPADDARVEPAMKLLGGQIAIARAQGGDRVVMGLFDKGSGAPLAMTVFDPNFPGAYPFRAARPELAFVLLRAIRPRKRANDETVTVVSEDEPAIADALLAAGARLKLEIQHMKAPLPAA